VKEELKVWDNYKMNKDDKYYTIIRKLAIFVLLVTITSPKIYSQAQGQRSQFEGRKDLCQPHTNKTVDSPSTPTWANISAPLNSVIHHSELGALSNDSIYTNNKILLAQQNIFTQAQDQRSHTFNKTDLCDSLRIESIDSPSTPTWANISTPQDSEIQHFESGALQKFTSVKHEEIYKKVDAVVLIKDSSLKSEFIANPGADLHHIMLVYNRARNITINNNEELISDSEFRRFVLYEPVALQIIDGENIIIDTSYEIDNDGIVSFDIAEYDKETPLIIIPTLNDINEFAEYNIKYGKNTQNFKKNELAELVLQNGDDQ